MAVVNEGADVPRSVWPSFLKRTAGTLLLLLTFVTLYTHEAYVFNAADPEWAHLRPMQWWLIPHITCAAIALVTAPLQFSSTIRRWSLTFHRWLGRIYVVAAIAAAAMSIYIVLLFEAPWNRWVMGVMGGLWLATTAFAWLAIRNRNIAQHRLWIGRSFGLTFTFVTTRFLPDLVFPGMDYINTTALYWILIVSALLIPDLLVNGKALLPWSGRRAKMPE
jgi:uncharacterized membrane protein